MASVKVFLNKHKKKSDGSHPVVMQIIKDRRKKLLFLRHYVKPEHWDAELNVPKAKHPNSVRLKTAIRGKLNDAERIILDLEDKKKPFTVDDIVNKLTATENSDSFFSFAERTVEKLKELNQIGNSKIYSSTVSVFKDYRNEKDISLKHIDRKVLEDFRGYLIKQDCKVNSISVYLRTLRAIYNRAIKEKAVNEELYPFKNFKIPTETTKKRAVRKEDIDKIFKLDLTGRKDFDYARDLFFFSFYMRGMSFIDVAFLKVKDIVGDRVYYTRKKTKQKFSIKLMDKAWGIIKKYNDLSERDSYIFPVIKREGEEYLDYKNAIRLTNKKLKKLSEMAGLSESISTYTARHSWATIAKRSGISTAIISEGLGHDSEETTQIYLDSFENEVLDQANELITG
ncbi:MAG: site-specific integrase [Bacteroidales bacterium]